jgi:SAM-dependent methyltransferase
MKGLEQHDREIQANLDLWNAKPLLRDIYTGFYERIRAEIDSSLPGEVLELGSGIGNLKNHFPDAIASDIFQNPWLDVTCDAYRMPFDNGTLSHVILFDVFHHLRRPFAFLDEARRVLVKQGRLILFEPYISVISSIAYGAFHHEPIAWRDEICLGRESDISGHYYAAQGNATRIFFRSEITGWSAGWTPITRNLYADLSYLFSGGLSRRAMYPHEWLTGLRFIDGLLSRVPALFASRCLVCLEKS